MSDYRLPNRVLFAQPRQEWRKSKGGQFLTWQNALKATTKRLSVVDSVRLPGWGPRDPRCVWLETVQDMASNRSQWRSCCRFLVGLSE